MLPSLVPLDQLSLQTKRAQSDSSDNSEEKKKRQRQIEIRDLRKDNKERERTNPPFAKFGLTANGSGISVIPFLNAAQLSQIRLELEEYVDTMPEYKRFGWMPEKTKEHFEPDAETFVEATPNPSTFDNDNFVPVEGGFAAMANPSSFHNLVVRKLRMAAHLAVLKSGVIPIGEDERFEQIADRLMIRRSSKVPGAEAWHRDEAKFATSGDTVYGGWVNLDKDTTQFFSCVPFSANEVQDGQNYGFATIPESEHPRCIRLSRLIHVPPGHILIFNERTIHEVVGKPLGVRDIRGKSGRELARCRLFLGWRTTKQETPLTPNLQHRLAIQESMPLKSAQHTHPNPPDDWSDDLGRSYPGPPPMYSALTLVNFPMLTKRLASHLKAEMTRIYQYGADTKQRQRFPNGLRVPILYPPSLHELHQKTEQIRMYTKYNDEEISILVPNRSWKLTDLSGHVHVLSL